MYLSPVRIMRKKGNNIHSESFKNQTNQTFEKDNSRPIMFSVSLSYKFMYCIDGRTPCENQTAF